MPLVRQATLDDQQAIFDFLQLAYPERAKYKVPERWNWQFRDNPYRDPKGLPVWIAEDDGRIVGQTCAMMEPIQIGTTECRVGWSVDTVVLPEYRGRGIGQQLQQANQQAQQLFMSLSMSAGNARIKDRLGAAALPAVQVLQLRVHADAQVVHRRLANRSAWLAKVLTGSGGASAIAWVFSRYAAKRCGTRVGRSLSGCDDLEVCEVDQFESNLSRLWDRVSPNFDLIVHRDADYLNWKFFEQPHVTYRRFVAVRDGQPCGYLIVRACGAPEPRVGLIVDLFCHPDEKGLAAYLTAFAIRTLLADGVYAIRAATTVPAFEQIYRSFGFRPYQTLRPRAYPPELVENKSSIMLSYSDHDLDQFPLTKA